MTNEQANRWADQIAGQVLSSANKPELASRICGETGDARAGVVSDLDGLTQAGATKAAIFTALTT